MERSPAGDYNKREDGTFEVHSFTTLDDIYIVDLKERTCSCKAWEMGRRPCKHIIYVEAEEKRKARVAEKEKEETDHDEESSESDSDSAAQHDCAGR